MDNYARNYDSWIQVTNATLVLDKFIAKNSLGDK